MKYLVIFYKIGVNNDIGIPVKESIQNTTEPNWIYGGHTVNSGLMNKIYDENGKIKYENVPWDSVKTWIDANPNIKKAYFPGCNTGESVQNLSKFGIANSRLSSFFFYDDIANFYFNPIPNDFNILYINTFSIRNTYSRIVFRIRYI